MELVRERASRFGTVVSIKLRRDQSPLAMIEMATHAQALALGVDVAEGGTVIGCIATVHLASPEIKPIIKPKSA